ncbi:MAG: tetratricopeptide repeat protein [Bacteroidales bacterium]|nr:tetratricopeptide repeat protein [Bacteroidales bacterium]
MKKIFVLFALIFVSIPSFAQEETDSVAIANNPVNTMKITSPEDLIARATLAYEQGNYQQTIDDYEMLVSAFGKNADLYYNLGNAYFKNNNFAKAILNYERCLIYEPSHNDASANLELARQNCVDRIDAVQPIIFKVWIENFGNLFSCDTWVNLSIALFLLFSVCAGGYFFMKNVAIRKTGFYLGIVSILLCLICNYFARKQYDRINERIYAIVVSPSVNVKGEPADSGTLLFTVHEGLKVKIHSHLSGWTEIELSDGNVGWIPTATLEVI